MNNSNSTNKKRVGQIQYLSELLGAKVMANGRIVGRFADVVIRDGDIAAEVTHLYITRPFGNPSLLVPWERVRSMSTKEVVIDVDNLQQYEAEPGTGMILLKDHVVDKKVLDLEGREVEVVYDVRMVMANNKLYVSDVDVSRYGLLRRLRLKWLADFIYNLANKIERQTVSWAYVQPLPTQISSFSGDVKLKVLKEKLSEMHPVDLADILEELDDEQRVAVFGELDTTHASDTLEEIDPSVQRAILSSLTKERIAQLVNEMTPGQAADVLAVLPSSEMRAILKLLDSVKARKIQAILEKHEEKILNYATVNFLKFPPDTTVRQAHEQYRRSAAVSDVIMYLYVVDKNDKLLGVIDIRELMKASDDALLKDVMVDVVAKLNPASTLREASAMFTRYGFRAIPIVDDTGKILGVVPYRDMMNLKHRFLE
jgi:CBS domain-containing protein/sporulation protein YlmC with PRC-barrel domain